MDEMDMYDKTACITDLKASKTVSTVCVTEVEWKWRCSMNDKSGQKNKE